MISLSGVSCIEAEAMLTLCPPAVKESAGLTGGRAFLAKCGGEDSLIHYKSTELQK